jgi:hypothetical protein
LKVPGTEHLKVTHDEPPSKFAFKFNLRRYNKDIAKDAAPFMRKASKYYESIAAQLCANGQGLTLVHVRAQLEQLQDTFMSEAGLHGGQKRSS